MLFLLLFSVGALKIYDLTGSANIQPLQTAFAPHSNANIAFVIEAPLSDQIVQTLSTVHIPLISYSSDQSYLYVLTNRESSDCGEEFDGSEPQTFVVNSVGIHSHRRHFRCLFPEGLPKELHSLFPRKEAQRRSLQETAENDFLGADRLRVQRSGVCIEEQDVDIILILDSSTSIWDTEYDDMKSFVSNLVNNVQADYGAVQFSSIINLEWNLGTKTSNSEILQAVDDLEKLGGATYTRSAVEYALNNMAQFANDENELFFILVTDGVPSRNQDPCDLSTTIVEEGIIMVVVGVGNNVIDDLDQVSCLANPSQFVYTSESFADLASILNSVQTTICDPATPFDGTYVMDLTTANRYYKEDATLYALTWDGPKGRWVFWYHALGFMTSQNDRLMDGGDWLMEDTGVLYDDVTIYAVTPAPSPAEPMQRTTGTPTKTPTKTPTTTKIPSKAPITSTTAATTFEPTPSPVDLISLPPTNTFNASAACNVLYVTHYRNCIKSTMDWIFILESGAMIPSEFNDVRQWISGIEEEIFIYNAYSNPRMSVIQYASTVTVDWNVKDDVDYPSAIDGLAQRTGSGATLSDALEVAVNTVFSETVNQTPGREKIMIIVAFSDDDNDVCKMAPVFDDSDTFTLVYLIDSDGTASQYACLGGEVFYIANTASLDVDHVESKVCSFNQVPFESYYNGQPGNMNNYPFYMSKEGYEITRQIEGWEINDPIPDGSDGTGLLISRALPGTSLRPPDFLTWDFLYLETTQEYEMLRIYCPPAGTPGPSRTPTQSPSELPSIHPTETCLNFRVFASPCSATSQIDAIFVTDSSSSITEESYDRFKEFLGVGVYQFLPESSRMGLMQFSTNQQIEFQLNSFPDPLDWRTQVESMTQLGGQTWTKNAMQFSLDEMWIYSMPERTKLLVLITDGQPTGEDQSPCELYPTFLEQHIQILVVGVGQDVKNYTDSLICFEHPDIKLLLLEEFVQTYEQVQKIYDFICPPGSPFDTGYSWTGEYENDYPTYKSNLNFISYWQDHRWWFRNPTTGEIMHLVNTTLSLATTPPDRQSWSWENETLTIFENVRIICSDTSIPTFYPTVLPTGAPSTLPTQYPSVLPSGQPSVEPTNAPTDCCTAIPDLLDAIEECIANANGTANPLLDILQDLFACDGLLENCVYGGGNNTNGTDGESLANKCCEWVEQLRFVLEFCESFASGNNSACTTDEDYEDLRGCFNGLSTDVNDLQGEVDQCQADVEKIQPIYDILEVDAHVEYWFTAVSDGSLNCAFVPPNICTRINTVCSIDVRGRCVNR